MKKLILITLNLLFLLTLARGASLVDVYNQALVSDPTFKKAEADFLANRELLPQVRASLLPQIDIDFGGELKDYDKESSTDKDQESKEHIKEHIYDYGVTLAQNIFDIPIWKELASADYEVRAEYARYRLAAQDLIKRVTIAYFEVLLAEELLRASLAEKIAHREAYFSTKEMFDVGVKTITDLYLAKAYYQKAEADVINAANDLSNKIEDLRIITGKYYKDFLILSPKFPLKRLSPNINFWIEKALRNNLVTVIDRNLTQSYLEKIKGAKAEHLPKATVEADYGVEDREEEYNSKGSYDLEGLSLSLDVSLPLYAGGEITSSSREAIARYNSQVQNQELNLRLIEGLVRKEFLNVNALVDSANANYQSSISYMKSLQGVIEGYRVGTQTTLNVLEAYQDLYDARKEYVQDRYGYLISLITLKYAAGILQVDDLIKINKWFIEKDLLEKEIKKERIVDE